MQGNLCLNCHASVVPSQKFCSKCGQKTDTKRLTFKTLVQDFFQSLFNVEKGILHLLHGLSFKPGIVALNYINGKRKQYFSPFGFLAISIAISIIIRNWLNPYETLPTANVHDLSKIPTEQLRHLAHIANERAAAVEMFMNDNMNIITVLITPYAAFFLWLFFRRRNRNFSEISLAYILFSGFSVLASTILTYLPLAIFRSYTALTILLWSGLALQTLYYSWGMKVFFGYKSSGGYFKVLSVLVLAGAIGVIVVLFALFFYVYSGRWDLIYHLTQQERT